MHHFTHRKDLSPSHHARTCGPRRHPQHLISSPTCSLSGLPPPLINKTHPAENLPGPMPQKDHHTTRRDEVMHTKRGGERVPKGVFQGRPETESDPPSQPQQIINITSRSGSSRLTCPQREKQRNNTRRKKDHLIASHLMRDSAASGIVRGDQDETDETAARLDRADARRAG